MTLSHIVAYMSMKDQQYPYPPDLIGVEIH